MRRHLRPSIQGIYWRNSGNNTDIEYQFVRNITLKSDASIFTGIDVTSGRKPVTFAALDDHLNILILADWTIPEAVACLVENESAVVVIDRPGSTAGQPVYSDFRKQIVHNGFHRFSKKDGSHQWIETNAQDCYRALQPKLLPNRTLEGRIQRGLILYDEGLQIKDPMDYYEEITRHKLMQAELPHEDIFSTKQLDALISAYVAWLAVHRPEDIVIRGEIILPRITENL